VFFPPLPSSAGTVTWFSAILIWDHLIWDSHHVFRDFRCIPVVFCIEEEKRKNMVTVPNGVKLRPEEGGRFAATAAVAEDIAQPAPTTAAAP